MKEIIVRRDQENINRLVNYKLIVDDGQTILIGNGETKRVFVDKIPVKVYAKLNWLKSRQVTVDSTTTELILKGEKIKSWLAPRLVGLLILTTLLPRMIWDGSPIAKQISVVGLSLILIWTIYAFIIKSDDWVLIDKKTKG